MFCARAVFEASIPRGILATARRRQIHAVRQQPGNAAWRRVQRCSRCGGGWVGTRSFLCLEFLAMVFSSSCACALHDTRGGEDPLRDGVLVMHAGLLVATSAQTGEGQGRHRLVETRKRLLDFQRSKELVAAGATVPHGPARTASCTRPANAQRARCATGSGCVQRLPTTQTSNVAQT